MVKPGAPRTQQRWEPPQGSGKAGNCGNFLLVPAPDPFSQGTCVSQGGFGAVFIIIFLLSWGFLPFPIGRPFNRDHGWVSLGAAPEAQHIVSLRVGIICSPSQAGPPRPGCPGPSGAPRPLEKALRRLHSWLGTQGRGGLLRATGPAADRGAWPDFPKTCTKNC